MIIHPMEPFTDWMSTLMSKHPVTPRNEAELGTHLQKNRRNKASVGYKYLIWNQI